MKFEQEFPFIRSEITPVDEEEMQMPEPVMEAMHRSLKELFHRYCMENGKVSKELVATVITCCCIQGTSLEKYSDLLILGGRKKNNSMIEEFNVMSRLPLHIIARTLIDYLTL